MKPLTSLFNRVDNTLAAGPPEDAPISTDFERRMADTLRQYFQPEESLRLTIAAQVIISLLSETPKPGGGGLSEESPILWKPCTYYHRLSNEANAALSCSMAFTEAHN
ncbi:hypothetical protein GGR53DRAFT_492508 [Hypoxylon sp. FL1150]|nr:hypothetical protein GGR53DRAFT_492508 [Hypoxylon sp. FL1150]